MTPRRIVTKTGWAVFRHGRPWGDYIHSTRKSAQNSIAFYARHGFKLTLRRAERVTSYTLPAGRGRT